MVWEICCISSSLRTCQSSRCRRPQVHSKSWWSFGIVPSTLCSLSVRSFEICPWKLWLLRKRRLYWKKNTYIFTSQLFSWLQNGQLNIWSNGSMVRLFGGGLRFDFRRPMFFLNSFRFKIWKSACVYVFWTFAHIHKKSQVRTAFEPFQNFSR